MTVDYPKFVKNIKCNPLPVGNTKYMYRECLTIDLDNDYTDNITFALMNPSDANEDNSDKTVNNCLLIAHHDLAHLKIGSVTVVNVHSYYEPKSFKLQETLTYMTKHHPELHESIMESNKTAIYKALTDAEHIFLCTGNVPSSIKDKAAYRVLVRDIHRHIEAQDKPVFLCKGDKNKSFRGKGNLSHHLTPLVGYTNKAKKYTIRNAKFIEIPEEKEFKLTHFNAANKEKVV